MTDEMRPRYDSSAGSYDQLVAELSPQLRHIATRYTRDPHLAEDIVQQTWLRVLTKRHSYDGRGTFSGWIVTICRNLALNALRSTGVQQRALSAHRAEEQAHHSGQSSADGYHHLALSEGQADLSAAVSSALARLPSRQRDVVALRLLEGLSTRETAQRLRCAEGTVKAALHAGIRSLRTTLREHREP